MISTLSIDYSTASCRERRRSPSMSRHCDRVTLIDPSCVRVGFGDLPVAFATRCPSCPDFPGFIGYETAAQMEGDFAEDEHTRSITPNTV
jgi:hypothetical protein